MDNELQNAILESLPEDGQSASSPEQAAPAPVETPTQKVEQQPPFNEHPAWRSFQERKEREIASERERSDRLEKQLLEITNRITQPKAEDPYANMSAEEKAFYQRIDQMAEQKVRKVLDEIAPQFRNELNETKEVVAALTYEKFLNKYPDVSPGSQEETQIAQLFQRGYSLDDAYKVVFFNKAQQKEAQKVTQQQQQRVQQKQMANLETSTIQPNAIPSKQKQTVREFLMAKMKEQGQ